MTTQDKCCVVAHYLPLAFCASSSAAAAADGEPLYYSVRNVRQEGRKAGRCCMGRVSRRLCAAASPCPYSLSVLLRML